MRRPASTQRAKPPLAKTNFGPFAKIKVVFRAILYLLSAVFLITLFRGIIGIIFKGISHLASPPPADQQPKAPTVPLSGELKKDPSCGTYISAATSLKEKVAGETFYFCSKACRDKYVATLAR